MNTKTNLSPIEGIKVKSRGLRGTLTESLNDEITGAVREEDHALIKFHGMYEQDDRDQREERAMKKLEKLYSFMIRLRIPGGLINPNQWIAIHHLAGKYSTGVIKVTTRQTVQLHGIFKQHIKPTLQHFDTVSLDSIAACGDVNRNVACASHPSQSPLHADIHRYAGLISTLLLPASKAYYEIWIDGESLTAEPEDDPLYQKNYLPRKFKIGIAIPPNNDVDVLTNDLGLIAIIENDKLLGFNIAVGGGLSATHGNSQTYPRLATVIGFVSGEENILKAVYEVVTIQRDFGNRSDRKLARLKYTLDKMGVEAFKDELNKRCGFILSPAQPFEFLKREDVFGWEEDSFGKWHYTLFIENGRITNEPTYPLQDTLLEIAKLNFCSFRFTSNQNIILSDISESDKPFIEEILHQKGISEVQSSFSSIRKNAIACVALPTCPLALAEAQRYLPSLIDKIEPLLEKHGILSDKITLRMTGCPNGCGRPYAAEIGLVGTAPGHYNLHIGGDRQGTRLNTKFKENMDEEKILSEIDDILRQYSKEKLVGETLGDFAQRRLV